ncbi:Hint domain-containing protein, partial [Pseudophaeobacter sp.]|uniref:Hint domain-containing protein n=1 Tax=Pseudophaeobacter sp. TaxID=1971739 RepID=UPI0032D8DA40
GDGSDSVEGGDGDDVIDTSSDDPTPLPDRGFDGYTGTTPNIPAVPADADPLDDRDTVDGGAGNDVILTGDDNDLITGGAGSDTIDGGIDDDTIDGGSEDDLITGGEGSDSLMGGDGSDTIYGGLDPAFPDGLNITDDGSDGRPVDPDPTNGMDTIEGGAGDDVIYGQDDDDLISGGTGNDMIDAGIDDDTVTGGTGDDTILGGQGDDELDGGAGLDSIDLGAGDGTDFARGGTGSDTISGISQNDTVYGGEDADDSDVDVLDLRGVAEEQNPGGSLEVEYDSTNPENGTVTFLDAGGAVTGTAEFYEIENVIVPCFTPGTLIATPEGERRVEDLAVGDRIITRDNGIQSIRWLGKRSLATAELKAAEHLQPILIREGALGNGLPERDMMVSPNHRVLVANDKTALYFEDREVLVAAKHLTGLAGVDAVETSSVTYIHFMFDQHEVVLSDGAWTESFQPGDQTLRGLDNAQRNEVYEIFPELKSEEGRESYSSARRSLKRHEARLLVH